MDGETTDNALHVGNARVVVKPAMLVLLCALLIGAIAVPLLRRDPSSNMPSYGYANPEMWKFEAREGTEAVAFAGLDAQKTNASPLLDADAGFTVKVSQVGKKIDSIYLRNAMNLDLNQGKKPLRLTFEARTAAPSAAAFPLTFTIRDSQTLLWSDRMTADTSWKSYEKTINLKPGSLLNVILAIHLGEKAGTLQIRNLQVTDAN
ncbi:MAG: hypothetical protein V4671_32315 [Armatimonadota bacterium]